MEKRILVIREIIETENEVAINLVQPYIKSRIDDGYMVNIYDASHSNLRKLLDEQDIPSESINQKEINLMFDINKYEKIVYVPQNAQYPSDILVYDPEKLDKNMIFYHIGNVNTSDIDTKEEYVENYSSKEEDFEKNQDLNIANDKKEPSNTKFFWMMISLIPWIIFLLMGLLGYKNITAIPLIIAIIAVLLKRLSKRKHRDFASELGNTIFFVIAFISNNYSASWMANIYLTVAIMGVLLVLISSLVKWEDA